LPIKAVLIDHDGTLVDSEVCHFQMWVEVLRTYGVSLREKAYKNYYAGIPTPANAADMIQRYRLETSADQLIRQKTIKTQSFLADVAFPLMPGALDAIKQLHEHGLKLAIVTGASRDGVEKTISCYGFGKYVSSFVSGDDVSHSKPAPDCYLLAMRKLGVVADECVAIEDTEHGVNAATAAGINCMAVPTPMSENHNFCNAVQVFTNLSNTVKWIIDQ